MFSSSDSEDETQLQQLLEAADPALLNLFGTNIKEQCSTVPVKEIPKSQRYLEHEDTNVDTDLNIPSSMRNFMLKKISELIQQKVEFEFINTQLHYCEKEESCVKLLNGVKNFIKTDDLPKAHPIIRKKPVIKRRKVDLDKDEEELKKVSSVTISGEDIIKAEDVNFWAPRKQRKIFYYELGRNGILYNKTKSQKNYRDKLKIQ